MMARVGIRVAALVCLLTASLALPAPSHAAASKPRWLAMGDSYSAGEGLEHVSDEDQPVYGESNTVAGSGKTVHECQRALADDKYSSVAWGAKVAKGRSGQFAFVACTGAITDDAFPSPEARLQAGQLEQGRFFSGAKQFDVVTFSMGGNNVGFPDVVAGCAGLSPTGALTVVATGAVGWLNAPWVGCTVSEAELKTRIDKLTTTSTVDDRPSCSALGDNTSTSGHWDDDGLAVGRITLPELYDVVGRCVAPGGTVVVMGYSQAVEETNRWGRLEGNRCHRIRRADVGKLRGAAAHLNYRIQQTVDWANAHTPAKFVFVDPNNFWEGGSENLTSPSEADRTKPQNRHALCGAGEDWLNGVTVVPRYQRSFHPKQEGHDAMARAASHLDFSRKPLTKGDLLNAPVPSRCDHPAGTLVDGELPGIPESDGGTGLDTDPSLITDLDGDGTEEAFAFINCSYGGVGTPDTLGVWGPGPTLLDYKALYELTDGGVDLGEYQGDRNGGVRIDKDGRWTTEDRLADATGWRLRLLLHVSDGCVVQVLAGQAELRQVPRPRRTFDGARRNRRDKRRRCRGAQEDPDDNRRRPRRARAGGAGGDPSIRHNFHVRRQLHHSERRGRKGHLHLRPAANVSRRE